MRRIVTLYLSICFILMACDQATTPDGGGGGGGSTVSKPTITSFTASPATIKRGSATTLAWTTSGADTVEINWGVGEVAKSGSMQIGPTDNITYRLTARNSAGYVYKECSISVENGADVRMTVGPKYKEDDWTFTYFGRVKNFGQWKADFAKVYIYLYNSSGNLIDQDYGYVDDTELSPGEASPWEVSWWDDDKKIRKKIDKSRTEYEIQWNEWDFIVTTVRRSIFDK